MTTANGKNRFGKAVELSEEDKDFMFEHLNKINSDTNGFSLSELGLMGAAHKRYKDEGN